LRRTELSKGELQGMRAASFRHALDGRDLAALEIEWHGEAGQEWFAVDEHAAGRALTQLTAMLGPGQAEVFA
jgi:hypothetical protein